MKRKLRFGVIGCGRWGRSHARVYRESPYSELAAVCDEDGRRAQGFSEEFSARYPKAVETLTKDQDQLLTFFDFPAEHWIHLRTTNPVESPFATVKARTKVTKGAGSRKAGLAMAFKLLLAAERHWRRVNAPHLVALVRAGVKFPNGQAEMFQFQSKTTEDVLLNPAQLVYAANQTPIHNI